MSIKILPKEVYMKIAAGEVVTNPAAVVKELIENSIDAKSDSIYLEIKSGGTESILIRDDGFGISEEDMYKAIQPHSTSKIEKWEDLLDLNSFGFRGEALASICAVSHMYFSSRNSESEFGVRMFFQGGQFIEKKNIPMNIGTEIEIRNIFYNVPARRKFLKSPSAEGRKVVDIVDRFLISNPKIGFRVLKDEKTLYDLKPEPFRDRVCRIMQTAKSDELIEVFHDEQEIKIHGFIFPPSINKPNRSGIITFVNGRYVKDMMLYSAVTSAYAKTIENSRYPISIIMIDIPSDTVDVNIHPQKLEVKFSESELVYSSIVKSIKAALGSKPMRMNFKSMEDLFPSKNKTDIFSDRIKINVQNDILKKDSRHTFFENKAEIDSKSMTTSKTTDNNFKPTDMFSYDAPADNSNEVSEYTEKPFSFVGRECDHKFEFLCIADKRYIIGEKNGELLIVDFHAAHEAVIFRELKIAKSVPISQSLMIPIDFKCDMSFMETARSRKKRINLLGFDFKAYGDTVSIDKIPDFQSISSAETTFKEIVEELRMLEIEEETLVFDRIFATMACRSAFKTGDLISKKDAEDLLKKIEEYNIFSCPHGRPVRFSISFDELDRYFKRI